MLSSAVLVLALAVLPGCTTSTTGVAFVERALPSPGWFNEQQERICVLTDANPTEVVDKSAPGTATSGDAPCFVTADTAAGGALVDFDGDGNPDIVWTSGSLGPPVMLRNKGGWVFEDATAQTLPGVAELKGANGVAVGDVDNDGDPDMFMTAFGRKHAILLINKGGIFEDQAVERGADMYTGAPHFGTSAVFGDYDGDGWLDLHTNELASNELTERTNPGHGRLMRNLGATGKPGFFEDVTETAGVNMRQPHGPIYSFVSAFYHVDDDGLLDLHVVSDFNTSMVFLNNGDGTFRDGSAEHAMVDEESGMGIALGDVTGDGRLDVFVSAGSQSPSPDNDPRGCLEVDPEGYRYGRDGLTGNRFFAGSANGLVDKTDRWGFRHSGWGWGATVADFDADGRLDLLATGGIIQTLATGMKIYCRRDENQAIIRLWQNQDPYPVEVSRRAGIETKGRPRSVLTGDLDGDGDEDFVLFGAWDLPRPFENVTPGASRTVTIDFGSRQSQNAIITLEFADGSRIVRHAGVSNGLVGARHAPEIVGIGGRSMDGAELTVVLADGTEFSFRDVASGERVTLP